MFTEKVRNKKINLVTTYIGKLNEQTIPICHMKLNGRTYYNRTNSKFNDIYNKATVSYKYHITKRKNEKWLT